MLARVVALWLALVPASVFAQSAVLNGFPPGTFQSRAALDKSTGGYQGPGDIVTFTSYGSCAFAYNAAYATATSAACDVVDTATGAIADTINFNTNGTANTAPAQAAGHACQTACSIKKVYDQTGNGHDWTQATLANMPPLTFSGIGTSPAITCSGSVLLTSNSITLTVPFAYEAVLEATSGSVTSNAYIITHNTNGTGLLLSAASTLNQFALGTAVNPVTITTGVGHEIQAISATGTNNMVLNIDTVSTTATGSPSTGTATMLLCRNAATGTNVRYIGEFGSNTQTSFNSSLHTNILARWGF